MRVLLVDDDPNFRALVRALLPAHAEVVGEVGDGDEAMALATDIQPDVVLMDFQMPRLDCAAAALAIGSRLPEVRVAMISGADSAGEQAEKLEIALLPKASVTAETLEQLLGDAA